MTDNHHHDTTGTHGMLLVGVDPPYLSHLPMFMHPHNYQVILKVALEDGVARSLMDLHREAGSEALFTVAPEKFPITDLSPADAEQPPLAHFRGDVVRGHFEHGGETLAERSPITVEEVVHFQMLPLQPEVEPERGNLQYLMFGDADRELYLAHRIAAAPDFDQVVVVEILGEHFTETEQRRQGRPALTVTDRADVPDERLRSGQTVSASTSAGQHFHRDVEVRVLGEYYFMVDELR